MASVEKGSILPYFMTKLAAIASV